MRIIAGNFKGRTLANVHGNSIRPTSDKIRGAIFNTLQSHLGSMEGLFILDLFAGSGALSIEALSRGANSALLIEKNPRACDLIQKNLKLCHLEERSRLVRGDSFKVVEQLPHEKKFDLVFIDPPYGMNLAANALEQLAKLNILQDDAWLVVETDRRETLPDEVATFHLEQRKDYGNTSIHYFSKALTQES